MIRDPMSHDPRGMVPVSHDPMYRCYAGGRFFSPTAHRRMMAILDAMPSDRRLSAEKALTKRAGHLAGRANSPEYIETDDVELAFAQLRKAKVI